MTTEKHTVKLVWPSTTMEANLYIEEVNGILNTLKTVALSGCKVTPTAKDTNSFTIDLSGPNAGESATYLLLKYGAFNDGQ